MQEQFRLALHSPELLFQVSANWGAENPNHRESLRIESEKILAQKGYGYISRSHTQNLGGFLWAPSPCGLDLELINRVQKKSVARISTPIELATALSMASLWTAKEAAFKALQSFQQPPVISALEISDWKHDANSQTEIFLLKNQKSFGAVNGLGCVIRNIMHSHAVFLFKA